MPLEVTQAKLGEARILLRAAWHTSGSRVFGDVAGDVWRMLR
jgi:hypothetical protein